MNEDLELLKNEGWILSESGLKTLDIKVASRKNITKILLDRDLREIGAGLTDLYKGKFENIEQEKVVLQILKLRNISAPKSNEMSKTAPKLLKLQLTDGQNTYSAIEMEPTALLLDTKPGTKICLKVKQLKYTNGQLLLTPKNMEILGGYVESLVSKWEISKSLTQMKGNRSGAAPPFIPFGQKIQQNLPSDRSFKSLQQNKHKDGEENSEFNAQRQDAIAEAAKAGTRKTFGGGNKTLVDSNVQKIMDKGYTEEQATTALKFAKNNVEKALSNLKRRDERQQRSNSHDYDTRAENSRDYNSRRGGKGAASSSDMSSTKPSTGVSLFDFLENKIPESTATTSNNANTAKQYAQNSSSTNNYNKSNNNTASSHHERFENNISSSFRKHDKENSNKSQQWSQYSSSNDHKSSQNSYHKNSRNDYNKDYRQSSEKYDNGGKDQHYSRDNRDYNRKYEKDSRDSVGRDKYSSSQYHSSNYSSNKPTNTSYSKPSSHKSAPSAATNSSSINNGSGPQNSGYNNGKPKYGKLDYNSSNRDGGKMPSNSYSSSSGANNNNNGNNNNTNYSNNSNKYDKPTRNNHSSNEMYQKPQRSLVDSMDKMSLNKKYDNHQSYKSYDSSYDSSTKSSSSYPPLNANESKSNYQQSQKPTTNYPFVGFQSKEANEQAKNALKTKNIPATTKPNWQQQTPSVPPQQVPITIKGPPPPFPNPTAAPPPQAVHSIQPPQPYVQHPVMHAMTPPTAVLATQNAPVFHATPITYPGQIIMQNVQPPPMQQVPQPLKVGDLCFAKYWEDGKFYNAKITGISESTYVVLFTEYGNAEEVRKTDCVPIISVPTCPTPPQPITGFVQPAQMGSYRNISSQQKMHQPHQQSYHSQQGMPYKATGKNPRRN